MGQYIIKLDKTIDNLGDIRIVTRVKFRLLFYGKVKGKYLNSNNLYILDVPGVNMFTEHDRLTLLPDMYSNDRWECTVISKAHNQLTPGTEYTKLKRVFIGKHAGKWFFWRDIETTYLVFSNGKHIPIHTRLL